MSKIWAVAVRDFRAGFDTPVAYVVLCLFWISTATLFWGSFFVEQRVSMRAFFYVCPILFLFLCPATTMRAVAEERRNGTFELLLTLPIRESEIVLGKFLAAFALVALALLFTVPYAVVISFWGPLDWGTVFTGYLGLWLVAGAALSIGLWISSCTENQVIAFSTTTCIAAFFYFLEQLTRWLPDSITTWIHYLSLQLHYRSATRGLLDSRDLVFFVSFITLGLLCTVRSLESRKWK